MHPFVQRLLMHTACMGVSLHGVCAKLEAMLLAYSVTCMAAELNLHKYFVKPEVVLERHAMSLICLLH